MFSMKKILSFHNRFLLLLWLLLSLAACTKDDPKPIVRNDTKVNTWIYDQMKFWYLWNERLPSSPDLTAEPEQFFESLLVEEDRFSWIQKDYQELINSLQGISREAGYEY